MEHRSDQLLHEDTPDSMVLLLPSQQCPNWVHLIHRRSNSTYFSGVASTPPPDINFSTDFPNAGLLELES
ncbi:hypothetical protein KSP40_PGU001691 [Platanthera guangdongensis]|uniref:Uncharacterized protein n=1 Tax=Platanthera guangdongensis TaxID=2320717 RepID=A0ABR2LHC7_9ASPA